MTPISAARQQNPREARPTGDWRGNAGARNDLGFWTFGLPLTAEGRVDESALRPGAVYRIPDSAGGGTGQWKSGAFYNFDQKSDWRLRTAADLDAYSGASDAPTPEERDEEALADIEEGLEIVKAGSAFTPAVIATKEDIDRFNEGDRGGIRAVGGDDEIVFDLGDGEEFLALPDDAAAHVIRNWEKYGPRLAFLSKLQDETLSPEERRRLVEEEVHRDVRAAESRGPVSPIGGRAAAMLQSKRSELRRVAEARLQAYDDLVAAMDSGATDEEVAELLENFQQAMLPELLGWGPVIGEVVKDLVPGLSNVRSAIH
ncbi:MAG: hypothetical protein OEZ03_04690, partial [Alphaproteobacteria bacterium]|nr:hypothetical protein [Alphaproteobacteria bacterium]